MSVVIQVNVNISLRKSQNCVAITSPGCWCLPFHEAFPFGVIFSCAFVQRLFRLNLTLMLVKTKKMQRPEMSRSPEMSQRDQQHYRETTSRIHPFRPSLSDKDADRKGI